MSSNDAFNLSKDKKKYCLNVIKKIALSSIALSGTLYGLAAHAGAMGPVSTIDNPEQRWTGFYLGANAGGGWADNSYTTYPRDALVTIPFRNSLLWGNNFQGSSASGFIGGGQFGYNRQINSIMLGLETDFQYSGVKSNVNNQFTRTGGQPTAGLTNHFSNNTPWFGTVRGKIGTTMLNQDLLFYGTGGFAYGNEIISGTTSVVSDNTLILTFPYNKSHVGTGYAVGAGGEWAINQLWSLGLEYLYVDLGRQQAQTAYTTTLELDALAADAISLQPSRNQLNTIRVTLNRRF